MGTNEEDLREQVARIIEPIAWNVADRGLGGTGDWEFSVRQSLAKADLLLPLFRRTTEQAWDEGLSDGRDRWMDAREFGNPPVNPYRVSVEGNE